SRAATDKATAMIPAVASIPVATSTFSASSVPVVDAPPFDSDLTYDPLHEVADEAGLALLRGRPVSILLLGVAGSALTQGPLKALEMILGGRGPTITLSVNPASVTAEGMEAAARGLADTHEYVLVNGGEAGANAQRLSRAATLTVLVASDDLEDERVEQAARGLSGCNYFIINTVPVPQMSALRL
ncbi:MAG: hypothetical protein ACRC7C_01945, partial [Beijerinckiaceae bacterium]